MKQIWKRTISILLVVLMLCGAAPLTAGAENSYKVGDVIEFGTYPQTEVRDSATVAELNKQSGSWQSYRYYSGTFVTDGDKYNGSMTASDYMRYKDVFYNSKKYRAVTFDTYRPYVTSYTTTTSGANSHQDNNGYYCGNVYWFVYEPIQWIVLDPDSGLVMSKSVLDSQAFSNYVKSVLVQKYTTFNAYKYYNETPGVFASDYASSSIRSWLNTDFYNTAFSSAEKEYIKSSLLDNRCYYSLIGETGYERFDSEETNDFVFLLSYSEMLNPAYGFSTSTSGVAARQARASDYSKCQGLVSGSTYADSLGYRQWMLRTAGEISQANLGGRNKCMATAGGGVTNAQDVGLTLDGVRPAMRLSKIPSPAPTSIAVKTMPTRTIYVVGESFDQTGLTLTATYPDGSAKTITSGFTCSGFSSTVAETKTITVSYEGLTTTFTVTIIPVEGPEEGYTLGRDTYRFANFGYTSGNDYGCTYFHSHKKGHCFGMAITSSAFYMGLLSKGKNQNMPLYDFPASKSLKELICYYHARQSESVIVNSIVAGGTYEKSDYRDTNPDRDWNEVVNYVKNHKRDNKGDLVINFHSEHNEHHTINFINYRVVDGQERINVYDNVRPEYHKYIYYSNGRIQYAFDGVNTHPTTLNAIALLDVQKYFNKVDSIDTRRVIFAPKDTISIIKDALTKIEVIPFPFAQSDGDGEECVSFEIPEDCTSIEITPLVDHAEFEYLGTVYSFGDVKENTKATLTLSSSEEVNDAVFVVTGEKTVSDITVKTMPTKARYTVGERFDQTGLTLTATYSDGSTETISDGFTCSGFSSATTGTKTVTVTYEGKTATFTVTVEPAKQPEITIRNFVANKTVDYRTTITFTAVVDNPVEGGEMGWLIDGKLAGKGDTITVKEAKKDFTVQAAYRINSSTGVLSEIETVKVKSGFFAKLKAFFRILFGILPVVVQEYPIVDSADRLT